MGISLKNGGHSWLFLFCFLVFLVLAECEYDPAHVLNCTYIVTVETLCPKDAATTRPVYIRFGDKDKNEVIVRPLNSKFSRRIKPFAVNALNKNASIKPFQTCTIDEYQVKAVCAHTKICYIYFMLMEEKDNWKVGSVRVQLMDESKNKLSSQNYMLGRSMPPKAWNGVDECGLQEGISAITKFKNTIKKGLRFLKGKKTRRTGIFP